MPGGQVVGDASWPGHRACRLRQLDVEAHAKDRRARIGDREEGGEVQRADDADEAYVLLATVRDGSVLNGEKDARVGGGARVVDHRARGVVEGLNGEVGEVRPVIVEATTPVEHQAVDDGAAVELGAKGVEEDTRVHGEKLEGAARDLERMGALEDRHRRVDLGVDIRGI